MENKETQPCKFHLQLNQETEITHIVQNIHGNCHKHLRCDGSCEGGMKGKKLPPPTPEWGEDQGIQVSENGSKYNLPEVGNALSSVLTMLLNLG